MTKTASLTTLALIAFAANSLLCRFALGTGQIDPIAFTAIRLISGALALVPLARFSTERERPSKQPSSWFSAWLLFGYAMAFSLAYISLDAGTGALLLFGLVQITMLVSALRSGERLLGLQWFGFIVSVAGLAILLWPGIAAPSVWGAALMAMAGIAWGLYSIRGRQVSAPVTMTARNFSRASVPASIVCAAAYASVEVTPQGALLAVISGAVTSGIGYVLWYRALPHLSTSQASIVQLLVPIFAAVGGVLFLAEELTSRLVLASVMVLGGVAAVIAAKRKLGPQA